MLGQFQADKKNWKKITIANQDDYNKLQNRANKGAFIVAATHSSQDKKYKVGHVAVVLPLGDMPEYSSSKWGDLTVPYVLDGNKGIKPLSGAWGPDRFDAYEIQFYEYIGEKEESESDSKQNNSQQPIWIETEDGYTPYVWVDMGKGSQLVSVQTYYEYQKFLESFENIYKNLQKIRWR